MCLLQQTQATLAMEVHQPRRRIKLLLAALFIPWVLAGVQVVGAAYQAQLPLDGALQLLLVLVLVFSFVFGLRQTLGKT